jgi:antitoxin component of MazEF toxin-antitoxin module
MNNERFVRIIRKNGTSLGINIPPEILSLLDLKEGEIVEVEIKKIKK